MARRAAPRDYKAEYARRIANALARGKTRAVARGHADEERRAAASRNAAIARKEERELRAPPRAPPLRKSPLVSVPPTARDKRAYRDYIREQAYRANADPEAMIREWMPYFVSIGRMRFEQIRQTRNTLRRKWMAGGRVSGAQYTLDGLDDFARTFDAYDWLLFYH